MCVALPRDLHRFAPPQSLFWGGIVLVIVRALCLYLSECAGSLFRAFVPVIPVRLISLILTLQALFCHRHVFLNEGK